MQSSGNGKPQVCIQNLLQTIRGEVPYDRIKGIDGTLIDRPSELVKADLAADVEFLIETYEPRAKMNSVELKALAAKIGGFAVHTDINNLS